MAPASLPATLTSFVGRTADVAAVTQRLAVNRLVTVTGPGGVGKTRLALVVAAHHERARYVDLSSVSDPATVSADLAPALAPVLAGDELRAESYLLVLDNCEHLAAA